MLSNSVTDIYLYSVIDKTTTKITSGANSNSWRPSISASGQYVLFSSYASNLVAETSGDPALYLYDTHNQLIGLVSATTSKTVNGFDATITHDNKWIFFWSDSADIVPGDTNGVVDLFGIKFRK